MSRASAEARSLVDAGVYTWSDGSTYSGDWFEGMKHGRGLYVYANGDVYEGGYYNGVKHGYGAAAWSNGSRYEGNWDSGREHGQGKYFTATGQCYTGSFNQGFVDGEGMHTWADGSTFYCLHSMGAAVSQGHYVASEPAKLDPPEQPARTLPRPTYLPTPIPTTHLPNPTPTYDRGLVQMPNGQLGYIVPVALSPPVSPRGATMAAQARTPIASPYASREARPKSRSGSRPKSRSSSGGRNKGSRIVTNPYGAANPAMTARNSTNQGPTTNAFVPFAQPMSSNAAPAVPRNGLTHQTLRPLPLALTGLQPTMGQNRMM
jgi:hypothetical protein